jgi:hypothetical protein
MESETLTPTGYTVILRKGPLVVLREKFTEYDEAWKRYRELEINYFKAFRGAYWVDFRTHYV